MIKAILFDLDGTLIQTEVLKARSYAEAIHMLTKQSVHKQKVLDCFYKYVGLSRMEVVAGLVKEFEPELKRHFNGNGIEAMQEWMLSKRLERYSAILEDEKLLSEHFCPYNLGLLHKLHLDNFTIVVATMSHLAEADKILDFMGIRKKLSGLLTRDDVEKGKPDPEIYLKALEILQLTAKECLVIEDSVNGIKAALKAGIKVFAVTNNITLSSVHESKTISKKYIIDNPENLRERVYRFITEKLPTESVQKKFKLNFLFYKYLVYSCI